MTISSVRISYPAECNCHLLYRMTSESYLMSSLPLLQLYINQCKFRMSSIHSKIIILLYSMYYYVLQVLQCMKKLLKCTHVHPCLFHSNVSNIQQLWGILLAMITHLAVQSAAGTKIHNAIFTDTSTMFDTTKLIF